MRTGDVSTYDVMVATCERHGYRVALRDESRGWVIRVFDPAGIQACYTVIGSLENKNQGAINIMIYMKPILSLEPAESPST